ncbi:hypothetical protein ACFL35_15580 [Candidatus Riflebacteria bacterium]
MKLIAYLKDIGAKQITLAHVIGKNHATVCKIVNGYWVPSKDIKKQISTFLNLPESAILWHKGAAAEVKVEVV